MNRKNRFLDFIAFVLASYPDLPWKGNAFFSQKSFRRRFPNETLTNEEDYQKFIELELEDIVCPKMWQSQQGMESIHSFIPTNQIKILITKLEEKFSHLQKEGSELERGHHYFYLDQDVLKNNFARYANFYWANDNAFISYYMLQIKHLKKAGLIRLSQYKKEMTYFSKLENALVPDKKEQLVREKFGNLVEEYEKNSNSSDFQYKGFIHDKGIFIDLEDTLINYLFNIRNKSRTKYLAETPDVEKALSFFKLKVYEEIFDLHPEEKKLSPEDEQLQNQFAELKRNHADWVQFLLEKELPIEDIEAILNTLHNGKFKALEIPYVELNSFVEVFHVYYLFFLFDFFKEHKSNRLSTAKDFKEVINYQTCFDTSDPEKVKQLRRYYNNRSSSFHKHFPFTNIQVTRDLIVRELLVEDNKLKPVVQPRNKNFY